MTQAIYDRSVFFGAAPRARRALGIRERAEGLALCLIRIALVVCAAFLGAIVVRNVTHTMCIVTGQTPPAWTSTGR